DQRRVGERIDGHAEYGETEQFLELPGVAQQTRVDFSRRHLAVGSLFARQQECSSVVVTSPSTGQRMDMIFVADCGQSGRLNRKDGDAQASFNQPAASLAK